MPKKTPFSAKISGLLRKLIDLEIQEGGGSQADAMERLAIRAAGHSSEAAKLVLEEIEKDPRTKAIVAIAAGKPGFRGSSSGTKQK